MDLSTTPRRTTEGVGELQKTRVAKSVFSIRSLVDVEETELSTQDDERPQNLAIPRDYLDYRQVCILMTGEITAEITSRPEKTRGNIMKNPA
ncbi:hypothetical protein ALC53_02835 [Atta colombica]|uniref:Uncharacterized protein n=1 Tax=Atta colombica TaxID=520822 RepID=A0A195BQE1_9HYME|nr:hypothetical protein ALC53_02835 [Atta colombica]